MMNKNFLRGLFTFVMVALVAPAIYLGAAFPAGSFAHRWNLYHMNVVEYVFWLPGSMPYYFSKFATLPYVVVSEWLTPEGLTTLMKLPDIWFPGTMAVVLGVIFLKTRAPF